MEGGEVAAVACTGGSGGSDGGDESSETALRTENAQLRSDLRRAWTTELRMVEKARELAVALSKARCSSVCEATAPASLAAVSGLDLRQPIAEAASTSKPPGTAPVRRRTVDGAPLAALPQSGTEPLTISGSGDELRARTASTTPNMVRWRREPASPLNSDTPLSPAHSPSKTTTAQFANPALALAPSGKPGTLLLKKAQQRTKPNLLFDLDKPKGEISFANFIERSPVQKRKGQPALSTTSPKPKPASPTSCAHRSGNDSDTNSSSGSSSTGSSSGTSQSSSGSSSDFDSDSEESDLEARSRKVSKASFRAISAADTTGSGQPVTRKVERKNGFVSPDRTLPRKTKKLSLGGTTPSPGLICEYAQQLLQLLTDSRRLVGDVPEDLCDGLRQLVAQIGEGSSQSSSQTSPNQEQLAKTPPSVWVSTGAETISEEPSHLVPPLPRYLDLQRQDTGRSEGKGVEHTPPTERTTPTDEVEVFNQRQVARLISPLSRALGAKAGAMSFHRRLRTMSLAGGGNEPPKQLAAVTRPAIAKSRARTRLATDGTMGYSSDSEISAQSPSLSRSEKTPSLLTVEKTSSGHWYGSLKRRSRKSTSDIRPTLEECGGNRSVASHEESSGTLAVDTSSQTNGKLSNGRLALLEPPAMEDTVPSPRFDRKKQQSLPPRPRPRGQISSAAAVSPEESVFTESLDAGSISSLRSEADRSAKRSNSLRSRRSSASSVAMTSLNDRVPSDHLKIMSPAVAVESPKASPTVQRRFHFFTQKRPRRKTESAADNDALPDTPVGKLLDELESIFLPTSCTHALKYLTDSSLHWFHVVPCYDTWPIDGYDACLPVACYHYHHRHNRPHEQLESCCSRQPACSMYSYCSAAEWKFQLSLWELLRSEVVYLIEALLVIQDVHGCVLRKLQWQGHLLDVDCDKIFGNMEELAALSQTFSNDLLSLFCANRSLQKDPLANLIQKLRKFIANFHNPYQAYGTNYHKSMSYVDRMLRRKDFQQYVKFCDQHPRVKKRSLKSFLFEPVQRLQRLPMLLKNLVQDFHGDRTSPSFMELSSAGKAFEVSCQELDGHVKRIILQQQCDELQASIQWPTLRAMDATCALPDSAEKLLSLAPLALNTGTRWLLHHGQLKLLDTSGSSGGSGRYNSVAVFLFNDMLLLTRHNPVPSGTKGNRNEGPLDVTKGTSAGPGSPLLGSPPLQFTFGKVSMEYYVCKEPYPTSQIEVLDVPPGQDKSAKYTICVMLRNALHQYTNGLTLEAASEKNKSEWLRSLKQACQMAPS